MIIPVTDPARYGSRQQIWHPDFVAYMAKIYEHPTYGGMPDALKEDGRIQWEAPSNRNSGVYQHTHQKRAAWWLAKAKDVRIDLTSPTWISNTAKKIHPFGEKPCKRCGRVMRIAYCYPNAHIQRRLKILYGNSIEFNRLEPIEDLLIRIVNTLGKTSFRTFPLLLSSRSLKVPDLGNDLQDWLVWVDKEYIPKQPSVLSPGAMSNAPDRFDGFHSFNLCCRKIADRGRNETNLRSYTTDRRVFEYWSQGNWIAADKLMGIINTIYREEPSADGGPSPSTADHIGPLSLGFMHRPEFRLLSRSANSAKNNRMTLWDVRHLIEVEKSGSEVTSWHAKQLWNLRKYDVANEENALRLSKLLRDNQRNAIHLLYSLFKEGHLLFLTSLLELDHADFNVTFDNLRIADFVTKYDALELTERTTKYAVEQKVRRARVGFDALKSYGTKTNRHQSLILHEVLDPHKEIALRILEDVPTTISELNKKLSKSLESEQALREFFVNDALLKEVISNPGFSDAHKELKNAMHDVAQQLSNLWSDGRYTREPFDFEIE